MSLEKVIVKEEVEVEWENETDDMSGAETRADVRNDHKVNKDLVSPNALQPVDSAVSGLPHSEDGRKVSIKSELEDRPCVKIELVEIKLEPEDFDDERIREQTVNISAEDKKGFITSHHPLVKMEQVEIKIEPKSFEDPQLIEQKDMLEHEAVHTSSSNKLSKRSKLKRVTEIPQCKICSITFNSQPSYFKHMRIHNGPGTTKRIDNASNATSQKFVCDICKRGFNNKCSLKHHIRVHTGEKPYKCTICRKRFTFCSSLVSHKRIHNLKKPYTCDVCHKRFAFTSTLIDHKRLHTKKSLYQCTICDREFLRRSHLKDHLRIHAGVRPHTCEECGKSFARKSDVVVHERVHTGETPYSCPVCLKQFKQASALLTHQRVFKNQQPYTCDVCGKLFCYKRYLKWHKQNHAETKDLDSEEDVYPSLISVEKKSGKANNIVNTYKRMEKAMFSCDICKKQFTKQSTLNQHVELLHSLIKQETT